MCITTSAVQRHQSAERSILRQISSLVYPKIRRRRVMFFIQVVHGRPGGRLQVPGGGLKMAWLASAFAFIRARRPKKVRRRDLVMDESGGWLVMLRMSAFPTTSCQRMSRILRRHHWSSASVRCISASHSCFCTNIRRPQPEINTQQLTRDVSCLMMSVVSCVSYSGR